MPGFLYFLETEKNELTPADLKAVGLGHLSDAGNAGNPLARGCRGPEDKAGLVFSVTAGVSTKYDAAAQTWRRGPKRWVGGVEVAAWVGIWNNELPPGPETLARARAIAGDAVRLRDGNDWTVPTARSVVRGSTLPKELVLGEDGETWALAELPEFLPLCRDAERAFEVFCGGEPNPETGEVKVTIDRQEAMRIACNALGCNYRLGPVEASLLRLFGTEEMWAVLRALCDMNQFEAVMLRRDEQKKSPDSSPTPVSSPTDAGSPASSPATSPASAI